MKISIIVLNYKGLENTLACLGSLKTLKTNNHQVDIIVIDNDSQDGSQEALMGLKGIYFISSPTNLGYAGGNNLGIKEALKKGAEYILIINNDTICDNNLLVNLLSAKDKADIIVPKIFFQAGFEFHKKRYKKQNLGKVIWYAGAKIDWQNIIGVHIGVDEVDIGQFAKTHEVDLATGACMLVKKDVFEKIGLFDEKYFLYLEDMDFCIRAKKAGFKIFLEPKAFLWHKNAGSTGGSGSKLQDYYITRNRLLFAFKYAKLRTKIAVLRQVFGQIQNKAKRQALLDFMMFKFGKGNYGKN